MNRLSATIFSLAILCCAQNAMAGDGDVNNSIDACRIAIAQQLKTDPALLSINVGKMKVLARSRELAFKISSEDKSGPLHGVNAKCVTKLTGVVTGLTIDGKAATLTTAAN